MLNRMDRMLHSERDEALTDFATFDVAITGRFLGLITLDTTFFRHISAISSLGNSRLGNDG
jgi:hypothetical protein